MARPGVWRCCLLLLVLIACGRSEPADTGSTVATGASAGGGAATGPGGIGGSAGSASAVAAGSGGGAGESAGASGGKAGGTGGGAAGTSSAGGSGGSATALCATACGTLGNCLKSLDSAACQKACGTELAGGGCLNPDVAGQLFGYVASKTETSECTLSTSLGIGWGFAYDADFKTNEEGMMLACEQGLAKKCGNITSKPADYVYECYSAMFRYNDAIRSAVLACLADSNGCGGVGACLGALPCQTGAPWIGVP